VIESDFGAGRALGFESYVTGKTLEHLQSLREVLVPIGATAFVRSEHPVGSDIGSWQLGGVPGFQPLLDARSYFDYHHTAADTLDKVDPEHLQSLVATMGVLSFYLADAPELIERVPVTPAAP
jgi:hypothetical protein